MPPLPGLFSALGLLFSGVEHHGIRSCLLSGEALGVEALEQIRVTLEKDMLRQFEAEGFSAEAVALSCSVDVRFKGQASEIRIKLAEGPLGEDTISALYTAFFLEHERLYGHRSDPDNPVEVVAVRLVGRAGVHGQEKALKPAERMGEREAGRWAHFDGVSVDTPVLGRGDLGGGLQGPLLIDEYDSTIVVPPGVHAHLDEHGHILMDIIA